MRPGANELEFFGTKSKTTILYIWLPACILVYMLVSTLWDHAYKTGQHNMLHTTDKNVQRESRRRSLNDATCLYICIHIQHMHTLHSIPLNLCGAFCGRAEHTSVSRRITLPHLLRYGCMKRPKSLWCPFVRLLLNYTPCLHTKILKHTLYICNI